MEKSFRVYGSCGHRMRVSFFESIPWRKTWGGEEIKIDCSDKTGTNDYVIISIRADSEKEIYRSLCGQLTDGFFENSKTGYIFDADSMKRINPYARSY